jgi:hypothetical protein
VQWIEDDQGGVARRLTVVHAATAPHGRGTLAVFLRAADGLDEEGFAAWRKKFSAAPATARLAGDLLVAEAAGDQGPLRIAADVAKGERRVLAGGEAPALLSVNGRDVGREVMQEFLSR